MKITREELSRMVSDELEVQPSEAEAGCQIMDIISKTEGIPLSRKSMIAGATITASMGTYDDMFDKEGSKFTPSQIAHAILNEDASALEGKLARGVQFAQDNLNPDSYKILKKLTLAQKESMLQKDPSTKADVLKRITETKGSLTALLFAIEVNPNMSEERKSCYEALGVLLQLVDDYRDKHIDIADGIHTLITTSESEGAAAILVYRQFKKVNALFTTHYPPKKIESMNLFIRKLMYSIGFNV